MEEEKAIKGENMKLKNISKEEIENMAYDDLAYHILKTKGKKMKVSEIFKAICDLQNLDDKIYEDKIGDFFTLLSTEKRFIQLNNGFWDLRENHTLEITIKELDEDYDEDGDIEIHIEESQNDEEKENTYYDEVDDAEDDKGEDDLKDLVIVDENYDEEDGL